MILVEIPGNQRPTEDCWLKYKLNAQNGSAGHRVQSSGTPIPPSITSVAFEIFTNTTRQYSSNGLPPVPIAVDYCSSREKY